MLDIDFPSSEDIEFIVNNMVDRMANLIQYKTASHVVNMVLQKEKEQRKVEIVTQMVAVNVIDSLLKTAATGGDDILIEQPGKDLAEQAMGGGDFLIKAQPSASLPKSHEQQMGGGDFLTESPGEDVPSQKKLKLGEGDVKTEQAGKDYSEEFRKYLDGGETMANDLQSSNDLPGEAMINTLQDMSGADAQINSPQTSDGMSRKFASVTSESDENPCLESNSSRSTTLSIVELEERMNRRLQKLAEFENKQNQMANADEEQRIKTPQTLPEFTRDMQNKPTSSNCEQ